MGGDQEGEQQAQACEEDDGDQGWGAGVELGEGQAEAVGCCGEDGVGFGEVQDSEGGGSGGSGGVCLGLFCFRFCFWCGQKQGEVEQILRE